MPKKKKVTKAEAKASIRRLHKASKRPEVRAVPIVARELPAQSIQVVVPEVKEAPVVPVELPPEVKEPEPEVHAEVHLKQVVIGDAIEFGWSAVKSHVFFFIGIFLIFSVLSFMTAGASSIVTRTILGLFISGLNLGYFKIAVDAVDSKAPEFKELFSCFSLLLKYLIAAILYVIVVSIGLVLFIIPGVIWAVQFGFFPFVIVKERLGPFSALRKSSELTSGVKGRLIIFGIALFGINLLGLIAFGIGVIITIPLSVIAAAHVFHQLEEQTSSSQQ